MSTEALSLFHPDFRAWFAETYGEPMEIQALAWPVKNDGCLSGVYSVNSLRRTGLPVCADLSAAKTTRCVSNAFSMFEAVSVPLSMQAAKSWMFYLGVALVLGGVALSSVCPRQRQ
jgi:hypothetical protein